jgi:hypothetical protein
LAVGPVAVRGGAFGDFTGVALREAISQVLGVEHVRREQVVFVIHQVLAADHEVEHTRRVLRFGQPFAIGGLVCLLIAAQQIDQFVEQRHVRDRPGVAIGAPQRRVGTRRAQPLGRLVELRQQRFRRQYRPELVERGGELVVVR